MITTRPLEMAAAALLLLATSSAFPHHGGSHRSYKICVPEQYLPACQSMTHDVEGTRLSCVSARDRLECLEKVMLNQADVVPADPEDMYLASHLGPHFTVFKEIRTKEEPSEEFRYEAVAVVHKDQQFNSIQDLRGLKSCHTGIGRNVGYKIPIAKLTKLGVLHPDHDSSLSARESELLALSQLFSEACLVGKWSEDDNINRRLKTTYSNLCARCEHPDRCDYPDNFSGYDGALRCLSDNGGQVAWTKVYFVKKHFGIPIGGEMRVTNATRYNPEDYSYLCPDGTKKPILGPACRWAARPWQGFIANGDLTSDVDDLRDQIKIVASRGEANDAVWLTKILTLIKDKTLAVDSPTPVLDPLAYLNKANYTDVIERLSNRPKVRICVRSETELAKCNSLSRAAFSRDVRPEFACVLKEGELHPCLRAIQDGEADMIAVDAGEAHVARTQFNLKPIVTEVYGAHDALYYAVAVVKKTSNINSLEDLRGKRSCHTGIKRTAGWNVPLYTLLQQHLLDEGTCPYGKALSDFFSGGSCVPGANRSDQHGENPQKLCDLCVGDIDGNPSNAAESKCAYSIQEAYFGYTGAFRCLASGSGDVAFVKHTTVPDNTDGKNTASWAADLHSSDYELLCLDGSRKPVEQYVNCSLAQVPAHVIVTSESKTKNEIDAIAHAVVEAGELYNRRPDLFRLFGKYGGRNDLLFKDSATGFKTISGVSDVQRKYEEMLNDLSTCPHTS